VSYVKGPDFLIVGTMKGGTTSLAKYVDSHPDVCVHPKKELHFFDRESNYRRGIEFYLKQFNEVDRSGCKLIGEATPAYMYFPWIPERIAEYFPDVKLVFILRHPVDRAYSHYWFSWYNGVHSYPSFEAAIEDERRMLRFRDELHFRRYSFLDRGKYILQLERYLKYFDRSQIYIMITEDLKRNPGESMRGLFEFLEVDSSFQDPFWGRQRYNVGYSPKYLKLHSLITKFTSRPDRLGTLYRMVYSSFRSKKYVKNYLFRRGYPPMKDETRKRLLKFFHPYNRKLERFLGMKLPHWYR